MRRRQQRAATRPAARLPQSIGAGEGQLDIIAWAGYAENGSNDPKVNWVAPFEQQTGCKVNVKVGNTSDEMVQLMKTGQYDGVSASGDADLRLIVGGDVAPGEHRPGANYTDIVAVPQDDSRTTRVNGVAYGMPHGWGANLLMWNPQRRDAGARLVGRRLRPELALQGQDHGVQLADLHRRRRALPDEDPARPRHHQPVRPRPDTSSTRPSTCSSSRRRIIGEYWADYLKAADAFEKGSLVLGTAWQVNANTINGAQPDTGQDRAAQGGGDRRGRTRG